MVEGFNKLRWNCKNKGCFNIKCRPKIETFAECFPRRINFGDVDGLVEYGGMFCLLEWKSKGATVRQGQARSYMAFTAFEGNIVFVVDGDAETMDVKSYFTFWKGRRQQVRQANLEEIKTRIRSWVKWIDSRSSPP